MARRPYTTKMKPFKDSDIEVDMLWYPADPARGTLPFPTRFASLDWTTDPWLGDGPGEVYGATRKYNRARPRLIPGPEHVCGTQADFRDGESLDILRPQTQYNGQQIPLCCDPAEVFAGGIVFGGRALVFTPGLEVSRGGIAFSGTALASRQVLDISRGGIAFSGTALAAATAVEVSTGGVAFAGTALVETPSVEVSTGGIVFTGTALAAATAVEVSTGGAAFAGRALVETPSVEVSTGGIVFAGTALVAGADFVLSTGGVVFAGRALVTSTDVEVSTGGIVFAGTALVEVVPVEVSTGGIVFAGTALVAAEQLDTSTGGIVFAGTALVAAEQLDTSTGGIVFAGTALVSVVPAPPSPGSTCATSANLALGVTGNATSSQTDQWWKCGPLAAGTYHVTMALHSGVATTQISIGSSCAGLTLVAINGGSFCFTQSVSAGGSLWVDVFVGGLVSYSLTFQSGACP